MCGDAKPWTRLAGGGLAIRTTSWVPLKIVLFIGSLQTGGAERQALYLARGLAAQDAQVRLLTLFPGGAFWEEAETSIGGDLRSLYSRRPASRPARVLRLLWAPFRLRGFLKVESPEFLYSMLFLTNFFARIATIGMNSKTFLAWGIRSSNMQGDYRVAIPHLLCKLFSGGVPLMIANSHEGMQFIRNEGFRVQHGEVVHNGIDPERFRWDPDGRARQRGEWEIGPDVILVGVVGRLTAMKGHSVFMEMAALLRRESPMFHFVCVGPGDREFREELEALASTLKLSDALTFAGGASEMSPVYSAIDVLVSSSVWGEGFPNVIGEAMACGRPCVVTNVGDSAAVIGDCGAVVPPGDARALADAVLQILPNRDNLGRRASRRISSEFSLVTLARRTKSVLEQARAECR